MESRNFAIVIAVVAIAVLTLAHARAHFKGVGDDAEILQAPVSGVTAEMLAERKPIVITDRIAGDHPVDALARTVFRWQHATRSKETPCRLDAFERSRARFTLVYFSSAFADPAFADPPALVIKPSEGEGDGVAVLLAVGRVLVLPPGWAFLPLAAGARMVRLDDVFTAIFCR